MSAKVKAVTVAYARKSAVGTYTQVEMSKFGWEVYEADLYVNPWLPVRIFKKPGKSLGNWAFMISADSSEAEDFPQNAIELYGQDWTNWSLNDLGDPKMKCINLTNWSIQAATGFPKGRAPRILTGIDESTGDVLGYEEKYLLSVDGKVVEYYGPAMPNEEETDPKERVILNLLDINPEYEKYIRRWCIETWDPENPIILKSKNGEQNE